jgi:hypothetical protein
VYSRDVVFREMKDVVKNEVPPSNEEPERIEFDLRDDESIIKLYRRIQIRRRRSSYSSIEDIGSRKKATRKWIQRMESSGNIPWMKKW